MKAFGPNSPKENRQIQMAKEEGSRYEFSVSRLYGALKKQNRTLCYSTHNNI